MQSPENLPLSETLGDRVFDGRYRVECLLAHSALGVLYRARDLTLEESVCIELLPHCLAASKQAWTSARSCLRRVAALEHARIMQIYGFGLLSDGLPFVITEQLAGESLRQLLAQGAVPLQRALRLARQICEALGAAHLTSVLHGALEPAHVTVSDPDTENERVKLRGFGIAPYLPARRFPAIPGVSPIHHYVSPEHIQRHELDARSDVYALGAILYELVTGAPPFRARDAGELLCQHLDDLPEAPSSRLGSSALPLRVLDKIVLRCLAKHPEQRYATMAELERDLARLERALGSQAKPTRTETPARSAARPSRRASPTAPILYVHRPAPASHVALRQPLPKVIINESAR